MGLYYRYCRWRGHDTTETVVHEQPIYVYYVDHLNGEMSVDAAHRHTMNDGFLVLEDFNGEHWAHATFHINMQYTGPPAFSNRAWDGVRRLEGIQEWNRQQIGVERWTFEVDKADRSHELVDHETEAEL